VGDGVGHHSDLHLDEIGFGQVLEPVPRRVLRELVKGDRVVDLGEIVVKQSGIVALGELPGLRAHRSTQLLPFGESLRQEGQQRPRLVQPLVGILEPRGVEAQHLPEALTQGGARSRVVADVADPGCRQDPGAEREERVAYLGRPPMSTRRGR
jgi:hypothetical protein